MDNVDLKEHQAEVINDFKGLFLENISALTGIDLHEVDTKIQFGAAFEQTEKMTTYLDLNGSIIGFLAISCDEKTAASLLGLEASPKNRNEYGSFMSEILNGIGGAISPTIELQHPILTIASPRLCYGCMSFPQSDSCSISFKTDHGDFELFYATDSMALKIIELYDESKKQEKEIKLILDHVPSALLTFDMEGTIGTESSQAARDLFGDETAGMKVYDLIFQDPERRADMESVMDMLPYSPLPFEESMELAPYDEKLEIRGETHHVVYHYAPVYSKETSNQIEQIMLIVDDITEEVRLKERAKQREEESDFIHKVLKSREGYMSFLNETHNNIVIIRKDLQNITEESIRSAFRASHTIKGNSSIFAIGILRNAAHDLETELMVLRDGNRSPSEEEKYSLLSKLDTLIKAYDKHVFDSENLFGDKFDPRRESEQLYEIQESNLNRLMQMTDNPTLLNELEKIKLKRIYIYLAPYEDLVFNLAEKLDKDIAPLKITGENTLVHPDRWRAFFSNFIHLIRNSVDHGIETRDERIHSDKPKEAEISIGVSESEQGIHIELKDDGRGIDPDRIANIALDKGIIDANKLQALSTKDKQLLIFEPGFSTQTEITTLSGRGVGMDAMRHEIEVMGGTLNLDSQPGLGTAIYIFVPYSDDFSNQLTEGTNRPRMFKRINVPVYLRIVRGDGTFGHVVNLSPDGFRMVSEIDSSSDDEHEVILYLDSDESKANSIWVNIKVVNQSKLQNGLMEHSCLITSFIRKGDERRYELKLRNLQRDS